MRSRPIHRSFMLLEVSVYLLDCMIIFASLASRDETFRGNGWGFCVGFSGLGWG